MRRLGRTILAAMAALSPAASSAAPASGGAPCYDAIVVGAVREVVDHVNLNELLPRRGDDVVYVGSRYDLKVEVETVLDGKPPPRRVEVFAVMTPDTEPRRALFYLRRAKGTRYWAVEWRGLEDGETPTRASIAGGGPPRCRK